MSGFQGGPGLMTQYFSPAVALPNDALSQLAVDRVRDALTAGNALFPTAMSFAVQGQVDVLDESSGTLVDSFNVTPRTVTGGGVGGFGPAPVGVCVTWLTGEFKAGRRVTGRTFLVPVVATAFDGDGTLGNAGITAPQLFADAMQDAGATDLVLVVWSRPKLGGAAGTKHGVIGERLPDRVAVLRSRRD